MNLELGAPGGNHSPQAIDIASASTLSLTAQTRCSRVGYLTPAVFDREVASLSVACQATVWERKCGLRLVYDDFYDRTADACRPGRTIEIGGVIGNLKQRLIDVLATDIQGAPWLDCVADAQRLPFADACATNHVLDATRTHVRVMLRRHQARNADAADWAN
jgi:hypothetical protein